MAIGDVYRLTISGTGQGSLYQNTITVKTKNAADFTAPQFNTLATDFITIYKPDQNSNFSWTDWSAIQLWGSGMTLDTPKCTRLNGKTFAATLTGQAGTGGSEGLPPQAAHVTTLITGFAGRRRRGRIFAPAQVEPNQTDGLWLSTYNTRLQTAWNVFSAKYFKDTGTSADFKLGVWSERTASGCVPATPPNKGHVNIETPNPDGAFTDVTGFTIRPVVYSQRRRTRGVGR